MPPLHASLGNCLPRYPDSWTCGQKNDCWALFIFCYNSWEGQNLTDVTHFVSVWVAFPSICSTCSYQSVLPNGLGRLNTTGIQGLGKLEMEPSFNMIKNFFKTDSQTKMTLKLGWEGWDWGFPKPCDFLKLCHLLFWFSQALWLLWSCVTCFFGFPKPCDFKPCDFFEVVSPAFFVFPSIYLFEAEPVFSCFSFPELCISFHGFILPYIISSGNLFGSGLLERPVNKHIMGITTGNLCDGRVKRQTHSFQRSSSRASRSQP